jgi:hypothetical protein
MTRIRVKGHEFNLISIKDSYNRRAQKFKNNIIASLRILGLTEDDIILDLEPIAIKKMPASVTWYFEGFHMHYSYKICNKYVENLYVVSKIIELEIKSIVDGEKNVEDFIKDFREEPDVNDERIAARELLGVDKDSIDLNAINKKYKQLSKDAHPDMPNGSTEKFKELNKAHKILKRELE